MTTETILRRITRLAKMAHRDIVGQLTFMTELYEKTYKVSGKVQRKARPKKKAKPAEVKPVEVKQLEVKKEKAKALEVKATPIAARTPRSDKGKTRSEQARENMRLGQLKRQARLRAMRLTNQVSA